jgi:peroxiredoxin
MRKLLCGAATVALGLALALPFALASDEGVEPGVKAPEFSLQSQDGKTVKLSDYSGKIVVLEWLNPGCPVVVRHYKAKTMVTLADKYAEKGVVWLGINSSEMGTNADNKKFADTYSAKYPILNDASGSVGHQYAATNTPHMFIVGKDGKVLYEGAIDNDPKGSKSEKINYVQQALDEILSGKAVSTPKTKAYGCTVKFKA